jgi:hypothetical protein
MRFMSILGLCLMAVFALVQGIPVQEKGGILPELEQERARVLQAELNRLTAQIRSAQQRNTRAQQALSSAQQQLTLVVDQTQQAHSDRDRLTAELEVLRRQLALGNDELAGIQQAAEKKSHSLSELQQRHSEPQKKRPPPVPGSGKQGFTLRFASAGTLHRLVAAGTVSLYGMAGKRAWRLSLGEGSPAFAADAFPGWFHEMAASTVPIEYVQTLEHSVDRLAQSSVVWGVQLPPATKQGIASLTRGLQGGNLVIGADGQVTLEAE